MPVTLAKAQREETLMLVPRVLRLAGVLLLCSGAACSQSSTPVAPAAPIASQFAADAAAPPAPTTTSAPAASTSAARYEQRFLIGMIDHHQMAVMTGTMCVEKAVHEELRQLCEQIVSTQSREIEMMQGWLQDWYGITYEPQMSKSMERQMEQLAALSGAEFEMPFMEMMIRHHQGAVREGRQCVDHAEHRQLIRLCERIIATQTAEIEKMEAWLCEWYGRC
jgi:uncharacterized protein (DUF305 family)